MISQTYSLGTHYSMKIAVTSKNQKEVSGPASHCLNYLIYETKGHQIVSKQEIILTSSQAFHQLKKPLSRLENHPLKGIDCLISQHLGEGINGLLKDDDIKTVATNALEADSMVISYLKATIPPEKL